MFGLAVIIFAGCGFIRVSGQRRHLGVLGAGGDHARAMTGGKGAAPVGAQVPANWLCQMSCVRIRPVWGLAPALEYLGPAAPRGFSWWSIRDPDFAGAVRLAARPLAKGVITDAIDRIPMGS